MGGKPTYRPPATTESDPEATTSVQAISLQQPADLNQWHLEMDGGANGALPPQCLPPQSHGPIP
jgi:hypothetical protein